MLKILGALFLLVCTYITHSQTEPCSRYKSFKHASAKSNLADERLEHYDLKHVFLDLNADNTSTTISGKATLLVEITEETSLLVLELIDDLTISSIRINETLTTFSHQDELIEIDLPETFAPGALLNCQVSYSGVPNPEPGIFSGINNAFSSAWDNQVTWTLSEPFNAKMWWPCKQVLTDKMDSVRIFVTTDDHLKAGSNGVLTNVTILPENKIRYEWKSNYPIAYYLIAITIAEYVEYNNYAKPEALIDDSILIQNFIYDNPEALSYYKDELDDIPEMIELFSDHYGLYPFHREKYGHAMAPFSGGMEHQTMSSMGLFTFSLDAHELAHQWFGDLVTCATWQDIWINEGFARFSEYLAIEKILSEHNARENRTDDMQAVIRNSGGSVFVPEASATDESRIFNSRLTYSKGGLILHMLRRIISDDSLFFQVLRSFLDQYSHSTATGEDFKSVLETETGQNFDDFFDQWYYGEGHPVFDITWQTKNDSLLLTVNQTTTSTTSLFTTPLEFVVSYESGEMDTFRVSQNRNQQQVSVPLSGTVQDLAFDPDNWLIREVDRFVRLDENGNEILGSENLNVFTLYPNPATNELIFSMPLKNIRITDVSGKVVWSAKDDKRGSTKIEINQLSPGIYLFTAKGTKGNIRERFIKK